MVGGSFVLSPTAVLAPRKVNAPGTSCSTNEKSSAPDTGCSGLVARSAPNSPAVASDAKAAWLASLIVTG